MDLCNNEAWLQESAQIEDGYGCQVEAGLAMQNYQQAVNALTPDQMRQTHQQMRVQSILFTELYRWMNKWNLGAGFEGTYTVARRLIRTHLANPTPDQQALIKALLIEDAQTEGISKPVQQEIVGMLSEMFTSENWQAMASAASQSISARVLSVGQMNTETEIV